MDNVGGAQASPNLPVGSLLSALKKNHTILLMLEKAVGIRWAISLSLTSITRNTDFSPWACWEVNVNLYRSGSFFLLTAFEYNQILAHAYQYPKRQAR